MKYQKPTIPRNRRKEKLLPTSKMSNLTDYLDLKLQLINDIIKAEWLQVWAAKLEPSGGEYQKWWRWRGWLLDTVSGCWIYKMSAWAHAVRGFRQEGCRINTSVQTHSSLQGCVGETWRQMTSELFLSSSGAAEHHGYISTTRKSLPVLEPIKQRRSILYFSVDINR